MAAGNTYTQIASTTLGSAASSVTFSSIPSTYTDLVLVFNGVSSADADFRLQFNGDTASNYSNTYINGNGSTVGSGRDPVGTIGEGNTGDTVVIANIMNYSNATTYKTTISRGNTSNKNVMARVMTWRSTSAINSIVANRSSGNFSTGSTFNLYGITAA
jgi:hypothetical protein